MCLVPGIADGRYLIDDNLIGEDQCVDAWCGCGHHDHASGARAGVTRRGALQRAGAIAAGMTVGGLVGAGSASAKGGPAAKMAATVAPDAAAQVVFLGTNGGPSLNPARSQPASALIVNGIAYLVDAGGDVMWQLAKAQIPLPNVRHLFITHYHSDHVAGYPVLASLGWTQVTPLRRLDVWGPTVRSMQAGLERMFAGDIASRQFVAGTVPFRELVYGHDVTIKRGDHRIRPVFSDNNVKVSAVRVMHGTYAEMP